ncbi:transmembrane protein 41 homolog isoform X3 [Lycorma delicatula]|uniref:transmembrane protein 41 homolog isoform X3 n=1 Tax=Lycorma delicatula TaxID=130591 RepID=UPI003F5162C4
MGKVPNSNKVNKTKTINTEVKEESEVSTQKTVITILLVFAFYVLALLYIYLSFPELEPHEKQFVKLPYDIEDAKSLGRVLSKYKDRYYFEVLAAIFVTYIFLQTFAIPGSISLSILSGFLFPFPVALGLICFCSATGASMCYLISKFTGRRIVLKYFPEQAAKYSSMVLKHNDNILNYILFLRMTPFLPNWFINIAAPVINVPLFPFWLGTFIGVAPPSFLAIQAGQTLLVLTSTSGTWSWTSVILLGIFAVLSLVPVILKNKLRKKFD